MRPDEATPGRGWPAPKPVNPCPVPGCQGWTVNNTTYCPDHQKIVNAFHGWVWYQLDRDAAHLAGPPL